MSTRSTGRETRVGRTGPVCLSPSLQLYRVAAADRADQTTRLRRPPRKRFSRFLVALTVIAIAAILAWPAYGDTLVGYFGPPPKILDTEALTAEIAAVAKKHPGTYGVYLKVLETEEEVLCNDLEFTAASCYKLPLALMTYSLAIEGDLDLDSKVAFKREDWEAGTGLLQATRVGTEFTIRKLVSLAIIESDNIAANMLVRRLGRQNYVDFERAAGARIVPEDENISCPGDMGRFAEQVFELARKHPEQGGELLQYLLDSRYKDRLSAGLPETVTVANKIGTLPGMVHDIGIVIDDHVTYVIAVMSKDTGNTERGSRAIADISRAVYSHISQGSQGKLLRLGLGRRLLDELGRLRQRG